MKLYLGVGPYPIHGQHLAVMGGRYGWTLVDQFVIQDGTMNWDATNLPVENGSVEKIYNSHLLEHFSYKRVPEILKHWYDKLQNEGEIIINVPDMEWIAEKVLAICNGEELRGYYNGFEGGHGLQQCIYGSHEHEGEYHKGGFIESSLRKHLEDAGFKEIQIHKEFEAHDMGCLIARAKK